MVDAFESSATDYLLKPLTQERFAMAVKKVLDHISFNESKVNLAIEILLKKQAELSHTEPALYNIRAGHYARTNCIPDFKYQFRPDCPSLTTNKQSIFHYKIYQRI